MSMLFNFRPLVINPELATRIGLNEAIVLQQVNYWINDKEQGVIHSGRRWVFNSYESWVKQFPFWSADTVKRAFTSLVKQGCLDVEQLNKSQHDRTNYYTINHDCELLNDAEQVPSSNGASCPDRQVQDAPMDEGKNARSLMVTTTKTTTEIKNTLGASAG
ncbi:conserved phage C-terminal domain-containing protein, partial [Citrobacter freundii]